MTTLTNTPTYDAFSKWLTNGQPRNIDGKPISATSGERVATRKPIESKPVAIGPARETSDDLRKRLERSRKLAERKPRPPGVLERATVEPKERKPYSAEARQRAVAAARIVQQADKNKRMGAAREYIAALPVDAPRPRAKEIANQCHICQANASVVIAERFGQPPKCKDEILAHLRTLKERPTASALIAKFGISDVWANTLTTRVFGRHDRKAAFRTGVEYCQSHPDASDAELMRSFKRSLRWVQDVRATVRRMTREVAG